jgi:hypothetical protein
MQRSVSSPGFYELGFAAQIIVWAMRKRLHLYAFGTDDRRVVEALRLARLDSLYANLQAIVDVLSCSASSKIELHGVACGCLATHEVAVLDALASLLGATGARVVWAAMTAIVHVLDARALRVEPIAASAAPPKRRMQDRRMLH